MIFDAIEFQLGNDKFIMCAMPASFLCAVTYVAARGQSEEEGAVQRLLNQKRISGIKNYILDGGRFPNNVILNWVDDQSISYTDGKLTVQLEPRVAQILDGQHRIAGLREAMKDSPEVEDILVPTIIAKNFNTEKCAQIFLSINTEQKTVPKSLIYDLYGLIPANKGRDYSVDRAGDIVQSLNTESDSPYCELIKYPGSKRMRGGIQLSAAVQALKPLIKQGGEFERCNITSLENQTKVIKNFFNALKVCYGKSWEKTSNPFILAAGFGAALETLGHPVLQVCYSNKDFSQESFEKIIKIPSENLILQDEVKGKSGDSARSHLKTRLQEYLITTNENENEFKY